MTIKKAFNITDNELRNLTPWENGFIASINDQLEGDKKLSEKQINTLYNILKREISFENPANKKICLLKKTYFRVDYHGDYLEDSTIVYRDEIPDTYITDMRASQYNYSNEIKEYNKFEEIEIPEVFETESEINIFLEYRNDYEFLINKLKRNKFRSIKNKNNCVLALESILNKNYDSSIIDTATGKNYKHW